MRQNFPIFNHCIFLFSFLLIGSMFLPVFVSSCSSSVEHSLLMCANSLMEMHPDSALSILESIASPQKLSRSDKAYYALLLTQARHKNYIPLDNDSLIKIAVDYYGDTNKSLYAMKAHYYLGATYRDIGRTSFAVEEYLKAIQLAPEENDFLAMVYENLGECYEDENLYDIAMEAYRKACCIRKTDAKQIFSLRGIGYVFLLQNQLDSALYYYQKALDYALVKKDSNWISALNHDFAIVYEQKGDYLQANKFITKAIAVVGTEKAIDACQFKGKIKLRLDELDSAHYYFDMYKDIYDIYGKAVSYKGLYHVEKEKGNWKAAVENIDAYIVLYDSIQGISDSKELARLMDNFELEQHKIKLLQHTRIIVISLVTLFIILVLVIIFLFLWKDRKRKIYYISLQENLTGKRLDIIHLKDALDDKGESLKGKLAELRDQQMQICISMFKTTECYEKLELLEKANPKQILSMRPLIPSINKTIRNTFIDVMTNLKECCPTLTSDDLFYCILSLLHCSRNTIIELMNVTSDALKTRKNRIKNKIDSELFEYIFGLGNR